MIKEFRVLAVSKETQQYETDMIRGVFATEHPMLDAVDTLPVNAVITILTSSGWKPATNTVINKEKYIFLPFSKDKIFE